MIGENRSSASFGDVYLGLYFTPVLPCCGSIVCYDVNFTAIMGKNL